MGRSVTVPESKIRTCVQSVFSSIRPIFGKYLKYPKSTTSNTIDAIDSSKNPEEINYWVSNPTSILAALVQQRLYKSSTSSASFGYPNVNIILGSDHGAGSSKFLFRANLASPTEMRDLDNIDSKSIIFQFASITCKKDTEDVISLINKEMNKCINDFRHGRLVGIKNEINNKIKVVYVPTYATMIKTEYIKGKLYLSWIEINDLCRKMHMLHEINDIANSVVEDNSTNLIWDVIPAFNVYVTGDLAFYATISGRENYSSCGCPYCKKTRHDWQNYTHQDSIKSNDEISLYEIKQIF